MKFLVFQHIAIEHPGIFRDLMAQKRIAWDAVELDEGEAIPSLDGYDALIVMGGPMDVFDEEELPWLVAEKAAIREAVRDRGMPYLGFCLGHQLLADALGGRCERMARAEIGILEVELTGTGREDLLFAGSPERFSALQWHGVAVTELPEGGVALARSPLCEVQAQRVGTRAWGDQYHVEMTQETVPEWSRIPAYAASLEAALGKGALGDIERKCAAGMAGFNAASRGLFENFLSASELAD
ncbi:MAG: type 1 glutamine amidotransferase [Proteobacteria bacterium]|nr:type 1 glutamine amidotransferase [Pseudomonadota bacterium]